MTASEINAIAVIPAAGSGQRMAADIPKQYLHCHGKPILYYSLARLQSCDWISAIYVSLSQDDVHWETQLDGLFSKVVTVQGGASRAESVANGLNRALHDYPETTWALVHDAARPCLSQIDLATIYRELTSCQVDGLILADKVNDTVKRANEDDTINTTIDRTWLWRAQTPQVFQLGSLAGALKDLTLAEITDEASAMEQKGKRIKLVQGSLQNIKVTRPEDLHLAERYLSDWTND